MTIDPYCYEVLPEVVRACPHLTYLYVRLRAPGSNGRLEAGLAALALLRQLKRVTLCGSSKSGELGGSKYVTRAGVLALAANASVECIHVDRCASFAWPDAQSVMREVQRPYLDIRVTSRDISVTAG